MRLIFELWFVRFAVFLSLPLLLADSLRAQDSVDVTFYHKPAGNPSVVYVPGEFNAWGHNSNGRISPGDSSAMIKDPQTGIWSKSCRLRTGGPISGAKVPGAYQYKFNENGSTWLSDPLNPIQNPADNSNSVLYVNSPTIFHFIPNSISGVVKSSRPTISAYIFRSLKYGIDTASFVILIDNIAYKIPGTAYDYSSKLLSFISPVILANGKRVLRLSVKNVDGGQATDSTSVTVQAGAIQILTRGGYVTLKSGTTIHGSVEDTSIHWVDIVADEKDTTTVQVSAEKFSSPVAFHEGENVFVAEAATSSDSTIVSDPFEMTYKVNHSPIAEISFASSGNSITLSAERSTDPDSSQSSRLEFTWGIDSTNPAPLSGVQDQHLSTVTISRPRVPGDYSFSLVARDPDGKSDTTHSYFTIETNDSVAFPTYASSPDWAKKGRIYELFFNSFTAERTIKAATQRLQYLHDLGVNITWVMPVMKNNQSMDNSSGTGYNIVDFYTVAPEYGTNQDFKEFVQQAHNLGLKVILDVTPNHTSFNHPFAQDARLFRENSFYWDFYLHSIIGNNNGQGSSLADGFFYYSSFSSQLLNYNWNDPDARAYMDGVYKWWIQEMGVDGFRFDVYWGPHNRADKGLGKEDEMGTPTRTFLRHFNPNIFLLGETAGTGVGTEVNYADDTLHNRGIGGGLDAAYDWNLLHNAIQSFNFGNPWSITDLNQYVTNYGDTKMGFVPGPNALFMRFMENHDEDRIAYSYGSYEKTMPMAAVIFTIPGIPMIYSGQEVGWGLGISDFDRRRRGVIDWNNSGKSLLAPHYQRLAWIRGTFPAFSTQSFCLLSTGNSWIYGYTRPLDDQNGIALENFDSKPATTTVTLSSSGSTANIAFEGGVKDGVTYYLNDVYNDSSSAMAFDGSSLSFTATLPAYSSAVYILSDSLIRLTVPELTDVEMENEDMPCKYELEQNFPNPFNPTTRIRYSLPEFSNVRLDIYNVLGQHIENLVHKGQPAGVHQVVFDGSRFASGIYFCKLSAESFSRTIKIVMVK